MNLKFSLRTVIEQLQGSNGIIYGLNTLIDSFEKKDLNKYSITELEEYFAKFQEKYNQISSHYEFFIVEYIDSNNENEKSIIKLFLDYCLMFLNRIQNRYSNPILYKINLMNYQKSIKKANTSIIWGIISVSIGIIAMILSVFLVKPQ
jgi:hypothetical protein